MDLTLLSSFDARTRKRNSRGKKKKKKTFNSFALGKLQHGRFVFLKYLKSQCVSCGYKSCAKEFRNRCYVFGDAYRFIGHKAIKIDSVGAGKERRQRAGK